MLKTKAEIDKYFQKFFEEKKQLVCEAQYAKVPKYKTNTCGLIAAQIKRLDGKNLPVIKFVSAEIENTDELRAYVREKARELINNIMSL